MFSSRTIDLRVGLPDLKREKVRSATTHTEDLSNLRGIVPQTRSNKANKHEISVLEDAERKVNSASKGKGKNSSSKKKWYKKNRQKEDNVDPVVFAQAVSAHKDVRRDEFADLISDYDVSLGVPDTAVKSVSGKNRSTPKRVLMDDGLIYLEVAKHDQVLLATLKECNFFDRRPQNPARLTNLGINGNANVKQGYLRRLVSRKLAFLSPKLFNKLEELVGYFREENESLIRWHLRRGFFFERSYENVIEMLDAYEARNGPIVDNVSKRTFMTRHGICFMFGGRPVIMTNVNDFRQLEENKEDFLLSQRKFQGMMNSAECEVTQYMESAIEGRSIPLRSRPSVVTAQKTAQQLPNTQLRNAGAIMHEDPVISSMLERVAENVRFKKKKQSKATKHFGESRGERAVKVGRADKERAHQVDLDADKVSGRRPRETRLASSHGEITEGDDMAHRCESCDLWVSGDKNWKEHLNGAKHKRRGMLVYRHCEVCETTVCGELNWRNHVAGSRHKRNLISGVESHHLAPQCIKPVSDGRHLCDICDVYISGDWHPHIVGRAHTRNVDPEKAIKACGQCGIEVVGEQNWLIHVSGARHKRRMVDERLPSFISSTGPGCYECEVCGCDISGDWGVHVIGRSHLNAFYKTSIIDTGHCVSMDDGCYCGLCDVQVQGSPEAHCVTPEHNKFLWCGRPSESQIRSAHGSITGVDDHKFFCTLFLGLLLSYPAAGLKGLVTVTGDLIETSWKSSQPCLTSTSGINCDGSTVHNEKQYECHFIYPSGATLTLDTFSGNSTGVRDLKVAFSLQGWEYQTNLTYLAKNGLFAHHGLNGKWTNFVDQVYSYLNLDPGFSDCVSNIKCTIYTSILESGEMSVSCSTSKKGVPDRTKSRVSCEIKDGFGNAPISNTVGLYTAGNSRGATVWLYSPGCVRKNQEKIEPGWVIRECHPPPGGGPFSMYRSVLVHPFNPFGSFMDMTSFGESSELATIRLSITGRSIFGVSLYQKPSVIDTDRGVLIRADDSYLILNDGEVSIEVQDKDTRRCEMEHEQTVFPGLSLPIKGLTRGAAASVKLRTVGRFGIIPSFYVNVRPGGNDTRFSRDELEKWFEHPVLTCPRGGCVPYFSRATCEHGLLYPVASTVNGMCLTGLTENEKVGLFSGVCETDPPLCAQPVRCVPAGSTFGTGCYGLSGVSIRIPKCAGSYSYSGSRTEVLVKGRRFELKSGLIYLLKRAGRTVDVLLVTPNQTESVYDVGTDRVYDEKYAILGVLALVCLCLTIVFACWLYGALRKVCSCVRTSTRVLCCCFRKQGTEETVELRSHPKLTRLGSSHGTKTEGDDLGWVVLLCLLHVGSSYSAINSYLKNCRQFPSKSLEGLDLAGNFEISEVPLITGCYAASFKAGVVVLQVAEPSVVDTAGPGTFYFTHLPVGGDVINNVGCHATTPYDGDTVFDLHKNDMFGIPDKSSVNSYSIPSSKSPGSITGSGSDDVGVGKFYPNLAHPSALCSFVQNKTHFNSGIIAAGDCPARGGSFSVCQISSKKHYRPAIVYFPQHTGRMTTRLSAMFVSHEGKTTPLAANVVDPGTVDSMVDKVIVQDSKGTYYADRQYFVEPGGLPENGKLGFLQYVAASAYCGVYTDNASMGVVFKGPDGKVLKPPNVDEMLLSSPLSFGVGRSTKIDIGGICVCSGVVGASASHRSVNTETALKTMWFPYPDSILIKPSSGFVISGSCKVNVGAIEEVLQDPGRMHFADTPGNMFYQPLTHNWGSKGPATLTTSSPQIAGGCKGQYAVVVATIRTEHTSENGRHSFYYSNTDLCKIYGTEFEQLCGDGACGVYVTYGINTIIDVNQHDDCTFEKCFGDHAALIASQQLLVKYLEPPQLKTILGAKCEIFAVRPFSKGTDRYGVGSVVVPGKLHVNGVVCAVGAIKAHTQAGVLVLNWTYTTGNMLVCAKEQGSVEFLCRPCGNSEIVLAVKTTPRTVLYRVDKEWKSLSVRAGYIPWGTKEKANISIVHYSAPKNPISRGLSAGWNLGGLLGGLAEALASVAKTIGTTGDSLWDGVKTILFVFLASILGFVALWALCWISAFCPQRKKRISVEEDVDLKDQSKTDGTNLRNPSRCSRYSKNGTCKFGDRCRFAHLGDAVELKTPRTVGGNRPKYTKLGSSHGVRTETDGLMRRALDSPSRRTDPSVYEEGDEDYGEMGTVYFYAMGGYPPWANSDYKQNTMTQFILASGARAPGNIAVQNGFVWAATRSVRIPLPPDFYYSTSGLQTEPTEWPVWYSVNTKHVEPALRSHPRHSQIGSVNGSITGLDDVLDLTQFETPLCTVTGERVTNENVNSKASFKKVLTFFSNFGQFRITDEDGTQLLGSGRMTGAHIFISELHTYIECCGTRYDTGNYSLEDRKSLVDVERLVLVKVENMCTSLVISVLMSEMFKNMCFPVEVYYAEYVCEILTQNGGGFTKMPFPVIRDLVWDGLVNSDRSLVRLENLVDQGCFETLTKTIVKVVMNNDVTNEQLVRRTLSVRIPAIFIEGMCAQCHNVCPTALACICNNVGRLCPSCIIVNGINYGEGCGCVCSKNRQIPEGMQELLPPLYPFLEEFGLDANMIHECNEVLRVREIVNFPKLPMADINVRMPESGRTKISSSVITGCLGVPGKRVCGVVCEKKLLGPLSSMSVENTYRLKLDRFVMPCNNKGFLHRSIHRLHVRSTEGENLTPFVKKYGGHVATHDYTVWNEASRCIHATKERDVFTTSEYKHFTCFNCRELENNTIEHWAVYNLEAEVPSVLWERDGRAEPNASTDDRAVFASNTHDECVGSGAVQTVCEEEVASPIEMEGSGIRNVDTQREKRTNNTEEVLEVCHPMIVDPELVAGLDATNVGVNTSLSVSESKRCCGGRTAEAIMSLAERAHTRNPATSLSGTINKLVFGVEPPRCVFSECLEKVKTGCGKLIKKCLSVANERVLPEKPPSHDPAGTLLKGFDQSGNILFQTLFDVEERRNILAGSPTTESISVLHIGPNPEYGVDADKISGVANDFHDIDTAKLNKMSQFHKQRYHDELSCCSISKTRVRCDEGSIGSRQVPAILSPDLFITRYYVIQYFRQEFDEELDQKQARNVRQTNGDRNIGKRPISTATFRVTYALGGFRVFIPDNVVTSNVIRRRFERAGLSPYFEENFSHSIVSSVEIKDVTGTIEQHVNIRIDSKASWNAYIDKNVRNSSVDAIGRIPRTEELGKEMGPARLYNEFLASKQVHDNDCLVLRGTTCGVKAHMYDLLESRAEIGTTMSSETRVTQRALSDSKVKVAKIDKLNIAHQRRFGKNVNAAVKGTVNKVVNRSTRLSFSRSTWGSFMAKLQQFAPKVADTLDSTVITWRIIEFFPLPFNTVNLGRRGEVLYSIPAVHTELPHNPIDPLVEVKMKKESNVVVVKPIMSVFAPSWLGLTHQRFYTFIRANAPSHTAVQNYRGVAKRSAGIQLTQGPATLEMLAAVQQLVQMLNPLDMASLPSIQECLNRSGYNAKAQKEMKDDYEKMSPQSFTRNVKQRNCFTKDEAATNSNKCPRNIMTYPRPGLKLHVIVLVQAISDALFKDERFKTHFIKGETVEELAIRLESVFGSAPVVMTDFVGYESQHQGWLADAWTMLTDHMCSGLGPHYSTLMRVYSRGVRRFTLRHMSVVIKDTLASGEMFTTLQNSWLNLCCCLWAASRATRTPVASLVGYFPCVVEGDDGIMRNDGQSATELNEAGLRLTIDWRRSLSHASFLSMAVLHKCALKDPMKLLRTITCFSGRYLQSNVKTRLRLMRARALCYYYVYGSSPIIGSLCRLILKNTSGYDPLFYGDDMPWLVRGVALEDLKGAWRADKPVPSEAYGLIEDVTSIPMRQLLAFDHSPIDTDLSFFCTDDDVKGCGQLVSTFKEACVVIDEYAGAAQHSQKGRHRVPKDHYEFTAVG